MTFEPRPEQLKLLRQWYGALHEGKQLKQIILKSRQIGMTTLASLFCIDCVGFYEYVNATTMADTKDKASQIFTNISRFAWDRIPAELRPDEKYNTRTEIDLSGIGSSGGKYKVSADAKGTTNRILHISEAPYFRDEEKILDALNILPPNGICIMEGTARGVGNFFEKTFMEAWRQKQAGETPTWDPVFFPWYDDPTNVVSDELVAARELVHKGEALELKEKYNLTDNQVWFWDMKKQENDEFVYQYYPSEPEEAFLHSGSPVFNVHKIKKLKQEFAKDPKHTFDSNMKIWELPSQHETYGIGVDSALGLADGDNSCIIVVNSKGKQVAEVTGKFSPHQTAQLLARLCHEYRRHLVVIENNNMGHSTISEAKEYEHINLYRYETFDAITQRPSHRFGWNTSAKSKTLAINRLRKALNQETCIPTNVEVFSELSSFVYAEGDKMEAMASSFDDRVLALSFANIANEEFGITGGYKLSDYGIY